MSWGLHVRKGCVLGSACEGGACPGGVPVTQFFHPPSQSMSGAASLALPCLQGLIAAINKHLEQALVAKQQGQSHWWKIHEACMLVLPLVGQGVVNGSVEFDVLALMNNVVLPDMSYNGKHCML